MRLDNPYAPFCTDHVRLSPRWANSADVHRRIAALRNTPIATAVLTDVAGQRSAYLESTPISEDLIDALLLSYATITDGQDLSIPSVALHGIQHRAENLAAGLIRDGVPSARVELLAVIGLRRRSGTRWLHDPQLTHTVVLLDRHTDTEVIVDPSVAAFAPVPSIDISVHDQLSADSGPYGDTPYVAEVDQYINGDHLAWDSCSDPLEQVGWQQISNS